MGFGSFEALVFMMLKTVIFKEKCHFLGHITLIVSFIDVLFNQSASVRSQSEFFLWLFDGQKHILLMTFHPLWAMFPFRSLSME